MENSTMYGLAFIATIVFFFYSMYSIGYMKELNKANNLTMKQRLFLYFRIGVSLYGFAYAFWILLR